MEWEEVLGWVILPVNSLALWRIFNEECAVLIPRNRGDKFSSGFFLLGILWGGVSRHAATPLIVTLSPGHRDITRFLPWSPIATGIHLIRTEKIPKFAPTPGPLMFLIRVQAFRDPLRAELPNVQIFMNDWPNPLTQGTQLLSYWFSQNPAVFQYYFANFINNLRGVHCFGSSRTRRITGRKSPRLNWATQCLTVAYDGAYSRNFSVRMQWISLCDLPCGEKKRDSSRLDIVEKMPVAWHASFQPL